MSSLRSSFEAARSRNSALLVGYLPAGFPSVDGCIAAAVAMVEAGVDVIEIGLPYSDPVMDGPVIQEAVEHALQAGVRIADVFATVAAVAKTGAPTLVMTYWNPVERYGVERFAQDLAAAGGAGVITPDLTPEESGAWTTAAQTAGLETVFLVAPSSPEDRIDKVAEVTTGFIYAASTMGVTGARASVGVKAHELVDRIRARSTSPVAVGLGVSAPDQAREVAAYADGVIVGSAFIRLLIDAEDEAAGTQAVADLAGQLATATHQPR